MSKVEYNSVIILSGIPAQNSSILTSLWQVPIEFRLRAIYIRSNEMVSVALPDESNLI
jgi:hypothetical protein